MYFDSLFQLVFDMEDRGLVGPNGSVLRGENGKHNHNRKPERNHLGESLQERATRRKQALGDGATNLLTLGPELAERVYPESSTLSGY
jgi:hypothetical protein